MDFNLKELLRDIKDKKVISVSYIQRNYSLGFIKSNELFNNLVEAGFLSSDGKVQTKRVYEELGEVYDPGIKIIFLDIDGVLNCSSTKEKCGFYTGIEDKKVSLLKKIVDATNAIIILVSTWRYNWHKEPNLKKDQDELACCLDESLKKQGLSVKGKIDDEAISRARGIRTFIDKLNDVGVKVDKFIIIDDEAADYKDTKMTKYLIQTSFSEGLKEKHVKMAIDSLIK